MAFTLEVKEGDFLSLQEIQDRLATNELTHFWQRVVGRKERKLRSLRKALWWAGGLAAVEFLALVVVVGGRFL